MVFHTYMPAGLIAQGWHIYRSMLLLPVVSSLVDDSKVKLTPINKPICLNQVLKEYSCEPKSDATPERVTIMVYMAASQI